MTWAINFCAPFIPNDSTINFHRFFQGTLLAAYSIAYIVIHIYYLYWGPLPLSTQQSSSKAKSHKQSSEQNSDNFSSVSDNKEVSIKLQENGNQSCVELKKTSASSWNQSNRSYKQQDKIVENVTIAEIQHYFPQVYGHFAIAMVFSIMYTPYAEQSISGLLYTILTIPLLIANSKRMRKTTYFFWIRTFFLKIVMGLILLFFFMGGLLEVGQSNWDVLKNDCFSNQYTSIFQ